MRDFTKEVYELVRRIPYGHVATYGQIAALLSSPRAARMVGTALRSLPAGSAIPWHRVINSKGVLSIENLEHPAEEQANLLLAEGIRVERVDDVYLVNLAQYLWQPVLIDKAAVV